MDIGIFSTFMSPRCTPEYIGDFARRAEGIGVESLWMGEHVVLFDPLVRHFGRQAIPVMLDAEDDEALFASLGFTKTPAIAVLDAEAKPVATFTGRIDTKAVARALRSVARNKAFPRR